jgi:hypothetical protein
MYDQSLMYDQSPGFGFTGSSMTGLPTTLDTINPSYYSQIANFIANKGGRLASVNGVVLYDTVRVDAGTLVTKDFVFFQNPVGAQQGLFIAGTQYTKQEIDVHPHITNGGQLSQGYEALIWSIGVQFHILQSNDASLGVGNALNLTLDPGLLSTQTTASLIRSANLMRAFQEGTFFKLFVNQTDFESGPGWRFPCGPYGMSGQNAISFNVTAGGAVGSGDGFVNNGLGWAYQMPVMRHIPPLTKFGVRMSVQNPFVIDAGATVRIVVHLEGIGLQPVTG